MVSSMCSFSNPKLLLLTLLSLGVVLTAVVVNGVYTGPRYGKRESSETAGRVVQRTSGVRNIQVRSTGERRFYPGTRFGGKRTYWQPAQFVSSEADVVGAPLSVSNIPYDCVYIPFVGVRCSRPEESFWTNSNVGMSDEEQSNGNNGVVTNENGNSPAVTGIEP